ncbi:MAG: phosphatidylserine/phosphatidylglycerophosphate/cardiolipin synthase family protein [Chthoniobacteraceae bacterium]
MLKLNPKSQSVEPEATVFRWLPTGAAGLEAMLAVIAGAARTVALEMYIFSPGPLAERFREALIAARRRGVRVQILLDAFGSHSLPAHFWRPLIRLGGELRWFNPFRAAQRYGRRNHRKLLVADGQQAVIGGFNIGKEYEGDGVTKGWRDLGVHIEGPLAAALETSFAEMYARADEPTFRRRLRQLRRLHRGPETLVSSGVWTLLLSEPGRGHRAFKRSLLDDLAGARDVLITCAYFVPTLRLRRALMRVARRGGRVRLILAGHSDVEAARLASRSLYARLMKAGVEIYEYQPQILHAKLVVIDGVVYAGSANLDARSLNINHELMIRVADPTFAAGARGLFLGDLGHSRKIDPEKWKSSRGLLTRFIEKAAYFLVVRIDPHFTSLFWRARAWEVWRKKSKRARSSFP